MTFDKWDEGWQSGWDSCQEELLWIKKEVEQLREENAALEGLLSANVRVIKEELRKEIDQENKTPDEQA